MEITATFILGILEIALLDLTLCGDNIGVIALATRNLPDKKAKAASLVGISGAILLRIYFAACITVFLRIKWLPIRFIGGLILIKVTWDLIKPQKEEMMRGVDESKGFWDAVISVIIADISMSLDNVLAIAGAANGNMLLITFGILLNIPIIFFGSQFVINLMHKYAIVIYAGGAILAFTSVRMILEDHIFMHYVHMPITLTHLLPIAMAVITLIYGSYMIRIYPKKKLLPKNKLPKVS